VSASAFALAAGHKGRMFVGLRRFLRLGPRVKRGAQKDS